MKDAQPPASSTGSRSLVGRHLLIAGGVLSAFNGASHLLLPLLYPWAEHTADLYEPVRWALYAGTIFFGLLLLWGGLLVVALARRNDVPPPVRRWVFGGLAAFWLVGALYEALVPFPAPVANVLLPSFSLLVAGLLLSGLAHNRGDGFSCRARPGRPARRTPSPRWRG